MPLPLGFVPPCLPTKTPQPPTGDAWLHEIKHDGFGYAFERISRTILSPLCGAPLVGRLR
jgi:hypothetical protein